MPGGEKKEEDFKLAEGMPDPIDSRVANAGSFFHEVATLNQRGRRSQTHPVKTWPSDGTSMSSHKLIFLGGVRRL
jgi:hypothetical protein